MLEANVSTEAEQAVLGAILIDEESLGISMQFIKTIDYFYEESHRMIYSALLEMNDANEPIDLVTVTTRLQDKKQLGSVGGVQYLSGLANAVPSVANIAYYAETVENKYLLRKSLHMLNDQIRQGNSTEDSREFISSIQEAVTSLADEMHDNQRYKRVGEILVDHEELIYTRQQQKGITGASTASLDLNKLTGGRQKKDLIILAARPSVGKTAFILNECLSAIKSKSIDAAVIISLEMHDISLSERLICIEGLIDATKLRTGLMDDLDWGKYTTARSILEHLPIFIDDSPGITIQQIDAKVKDFKKNHGPNIIVYIDFLQLVSGGKKFPNRETEISFISRYLKQIARKYDCPVVAISSLGRGCEQRQDKRPMLSDLRESGQIESDADEVDFLYRDDYYNPDSQKKNIIEIIIAKGRNTGIGLVEMGYLKSSGKFFDINR